MPPKAKFSREEIIQAALHIIKSSGAQALSARTLSAQLGSSASPIFTVFQNMEEVQQEVLKAARAVYQSCVQEDMEKGMYPPYKGIGMTYIRFAKEERELFRLLFMRDRSKEQESDGKAEMHDIIQLLSSETGLDYETAYRFQTEMVFYIHGIASMVATSYVVLNEEAISSFLTDGFEALKKQYQGGGSK